MPRFHQRIAIGLFAWSGLFFGPVFTQEPDVVPIQPLPDLSPTSLPDLLREYKESGLPLPPKGAMLTIVGTGEDFNQSWDHPNTRLGFTGETAREEKQGPGHQTGQGKKITRVLIGLEWENRTENCTQLRDPIDIGRIQKLVVPDEVGPDQQIVWHPWNTTELILAIQCQAAGQPKLAGFFFDRCRMHSTIPLKQRLQVVAWDHWVLQLATPASDRNAIGIRLKRLVVKYPDYVSNETRNLIRDLENTLKPQLKKGNPAENLIEQLVEHHNERTGNDFNYFFHDDLLFGFNENEKNLKDFQKEIPLKILLLGFEGVPALLEHVEDTRLTRNMIGVQPGDDFHDQILRVGHIAQTLLNQMVDHPGQLPREEERTPEFYHAWWQEASENGEEKYLLKNLFSGKPNENNAPYHPFLHLLHWKYPGSLPAIYRDILVNKPDYRSDLVVKMIAKGTCSKEEKVRLLILGANHKGIMHQLSALSALESVDKKQFAITWLQLMDAPWEKMAKWEESPFCTGIGRLAGLSEDPLVWLRLEKIAKLAPVEHRGPFLSDMGIQSGEKISKPRIRFLLAFFDDDSVWEIKQEKDNQSRFVSIFKIEIRNLAAETLASLIDLSPKTRIDNPQELEKFRAFVRSAAMKELEKK